MSFLSCTEIVVEEPAETFIFDESTSFNNEDTLPPSANATATSSPPAAASAQKT